VTGEEGQSAAMAAAKENSSVASHNQSQQKSGQRQNLKYASLTRDIGIHHSKNAAI